MVQWHPSGLPVWIPAGALGTGTMEAKGGDRWGEGWLLKAIVALPVGCPGKSMGDFAVRVGNSACLWGVITVWLWASES